MVPQCGTNVALLTDTGSLFGGGGTAPPSAPRRRRAGAAAALAYTDAATSSSANKIAAAPAGPLVLPPPCILIRTCVHCSKGSSSTGRDSREISSLDACWMLISSKPWCLLIACIYARSQSIVQTTMETIDRQASQLMLTSATLPRTTDEENVFDGSNRWHNLVYANC